MRRIRAFILLNISTLSIPLTALAVMRPENSCIDNLITSRNATPVTFVASALNKSNVTITPWQPDTDPELKTVILSPEQVSDEAVDEAEHVHSLRIIRKIIIQTLDRDSDDNRAKLPNELEMSVLYPLSSYDLTTPLLLFPNAKNYLLLDSAPLLLPDELNEIQNMKIELEVVDPNENWLVAGKKSSSYVLRRLLSSLRANLPSAKISHINLLIDGSNQISGKIIFHKINELGELDRPQTIYYLSANLKNLETVIKEARSHWVLRLLESVNPNIFIAKASMNELGVYSHSPLTRKFLLSSILKQGGLIVEGLALHHDAGIRNDWEVSSHDHALANQIVDYTRINDVLYGYDARIQPAPTLVGRAQILRIRKY